MNIVVLGVNSRTTSVDIREKLAFAPEHLAEALKLLKSRDGVLECLILSTCNRVEIYSLLADGEPSVLWSFINEYHGIQDPVDAGFYVEKNENAVAHLCKVAAGIDSMIIGEPQVFGQVKDAYRVALECGAAGTVFQSLFPQAFTLVKKVRSVTEIGRANVSVSHAAVSSARKTLGDISGKTVLIIGAGETGELTVRNLVDNGVGQVLVTNRTFERAVRLAERFAGTPVMFYEIAEYLPKVDIVISSLEAPAYVVGKNEVVGRSPSKPLLVIDISVPRSIDPTIKEVANVHLFNIDDLKDAVEGSVSVRKREAEKAVQIIDSKVKSIWAKLDSADLGPIILSLREMAEGIRTESLAAFARDAGVSDREKDMVDSLTRSIVNRIMHNTITTVREYSNLLRYR